MRYLYGATLFIAITLFSLSACHHHHDHGPHEPEGPEPLSYTIWTENSEFFIEFPPLVAGVENRLAAHFTNLGNFKPIEKGHAMVCLLKNKQELTIDTVAGPSSPGVFSLDLAPEKEGNFQLAFVLNTGTFTDSIFINDVPVYATAEAAVAAHPHQEEGDEVAFLKEQAWKIDFAVEQAKHQSIHEVIRTSGEFETAKGEEKIVSAKKSGIVSFRNKNLQEGRDVTNGQSLFTISSKGLMTINLEEKFKVAGAKVEKNKADFERAEKLLKEQIIGQKEYERRKMDFTIAEAELKTLTDNYNNSSSGQNVDASMTGIIKNILVSDGQFVNEGAPLIELTNNRRLLLHAEVSQQYLPQLPYLQSANFKTPYQKEVQSIKQYNGKLVSYGKMLDGNSALIPVFFELDNKGALLPGSFVELFLLTKPIENTIVIPKSALMQDYNIHYVYIQKEGESFEKREIKLGVDDGQNVQVLNGIETGEWVVTKGAYQVKMASMSSSIPSHGHVH